MAKFNRNSYLAERSVLLELRYHLRHWICQVRCTLCVPLAQKMLFAPDQCGRTCGVTNDNVTGDKAERNLTWQVKAGSPPQLGPWMYCLARHQIREPDTRDLSALKTLHNHVTEPFLRTGPHISRINPDIIARARMGCLPLRISMSGNRSTNGYDAKSVRLL